MRRVLGRERQLLARTRRSNSLEEIPVGVKQLTSTPPPSFPRTRESRHSGAVSLCSLDGLRRPRGLGSRVRGDDGMSMAQGAIGLPTA